MTALSIELQEALYDAKSRARKQAQRIKHGATVVTGKNLLSWFKEQPAKVQKQVQALIAAKSEPLLLYPAREVIIPNTPAQRIQGLRDLMDEYISKGLTFEDFFAGLKGVYRAKSGYVTYGFGMPDQIKKDLIELGYAPNLKKIWFEQLKQEEPQEVPEFRASSAGIDRQLAARSHAFSLYVPEVRARQEIEGFQASVQDTYERLKRFAKTPAQQELLNDEMTRFQAGLASKENAVLAAKGRTASSMITGGSNFPTARNRRALETEQRRYEELKAFEERAEKAIKRELKKLAIEEQGGELQALKNKIEAAKDKQEKFKQINKIIRKKLPADETVKMLMDSMNLSEATARKLITGDTKWDIGIPQYELTNNLANIRRMEQRVKELESKEAAPTTKIELTMGRIVDNADEDRVQIFFNEKPDESIRAKLKAHGWRWSPSSKAWQRKRTQAALQSANELIYDPAPKRCEPSINAALERKGIEPDTVDVTALIDSQLSCDENRKMILKSVGAAKTDKYADAARKTAQFYQGTGKLARASPQERAAAFAAMRVAGTLRGYDPSNQQVMSHAEKEILLSQYYPKTKFIKEHINLIMQGRKAEILFAGASEAIVRYTSNPHSKYTKHYQLNIDADVIPVLKYYEQLEQ